VPRFQFLQGELAFRKFVTDEMGDIFSKGAGCQEISVTAGFGKVLLQTYPLIDHFFEIV
jgi:hypothetical protein